MSKMNPDVKKLWVDALRSGKYEQGKNNLHYDNKYCCLGVLCELAIENGVSVEKRTECLITYYNNRFSIPPVEIDEWAGFVPNTPNGLELLPKYGLATGAKTLVGLNDSGASFKEIADIIDWAL